MPIFDGNRYAKIYQRFFEKRGEPVTLLINNGTDYDSYAGIPAIVTSYSAEEIVGTIQQGDLSVLLRPEDFPEGVTALVERKDRITIRGKSYTVMQWDPMTRSIAGEVLSYSARVRG